MNRDSQTDDVEAPGGNIQPQAPVPEGAEAKLPVEDRSSAQGGIPEKQEAIPATLPGGLVPKDQPEPKIKGPRKSYVPKEKIIYVVAGFLGFFIMNAILGYAIPYAIQDILPSGWLIFVFLLNVGLIVFLGFKNRWIAVGALSAIGFLMIIALLAALVFMGYCFVQNFL